MSSKKQGIRNEEGSDDLEDIKRAVSEAGVGEDKEIVLIQCENDDGDHTFHKVRLGKALKLAENVSAEKAHEAAEGCAV